MHHDASALLIMAENRGAYTTNVKFERSTQQGSGRQPRAQQLTVFSELRDIVSLTASAKRFAWVCRHGSACSGPFLTARALAKQ